MKTPTNARFWQDGQRIRAKPPWSRPQARNCSTAPRHDATQRARAGLEALLIGPDIAVEMLLESLVENGGFGMARAIRSRRIADANARIRHREMRVPGSNVFRRNKQQ